ncbi:MAG: hypothetical protein NTY66_03500, partial [Candidatus Vogelbacteria bacterium]|nr:hypothetical protein [Candidatus Vogelbacteria bacterium]
MARKIIDYDIAPDEIFLDNSNLPDLDTNQFEGRIERPISKSALWLSGIVLAALLVLFLGRVAYLQIWRGTGYAERSRNNSLRHTVILPPRGIIYDRGEVELAWNKPDRHYIEKPGFSILLGYLGFPEEDNRSSVVYSEDELVGRAGIENQFNDLLTGEKGVKVEE